LVAEKAPNVVRSGSVVARLAAPSPIVDVWCSHFERAVRVALQLLWALPLAGCGVRPSSQVLVEPAVEVASRADDEGFLPAEHCARHCRHVARQRPVLECRVVALDRTLEARLRYDGQLMVACRLAEP
jgi:hypothetical protein